MSQKFFKNPFANTGDKTPIPNGTQPDGTVSYNQGWSPDYQLPKTNPLAKDIERDKTNQLMNDITGAIQVLQVHGAPDWIAPADNDGVAFPYDVGARVRYTNGLTYLSMVAANTGVPSVSTNWQEETGRLLNVQKLTATGIYTPTPGTKKIRVRAIAGGGAGGGASANGPTTICAGSGGAAGGYAEAIYTSGFAGVTASIGAGGVPVAGTAGGAGGTTSFGGLLTCPGGGGGQTTQNSTSTIAGVVGQGLSGATPTGTGIITSASGQPGASGMCYGTSGLAIGEQGGVSPFGRGGNNTSGGVGDAAVGYGSGGGGASTGASAAVALAGGAGAPGAIIIEEFA